MQGLCLTMYLESCSGNPNKAMIGKPSMDPGSALLFVVARCIQSFVLSQEFSASWFFLLPENMALQQALKKAALCHC